jgi:hypothetical protein
MKKNLLVVVLLTFCLALNVRAQWQVYDASDLPQNVSSDFAVSDLASTPGAVVNIIDDPSISGNKLLLYSADQSGRNAWKLNITRPDNASWAFRIRSTNVKDYAMQFEMNTPTTRADLKIGNYAKGGYLKLSANSGETVIYPADSSLAVDKWHLYRLTVEGGNLYKLYLDEDPNPVAELTSTRTSQSQFLRFGYFSSSDECEGVLDWMAWDVSGAYVPGSGTAIPDSLSANSAALVGYFNNDDRTMASTAVAFDNDPVIQMLKADPNFDVDVKIVAVDSVVDLSPYDMVIVQEGFTSGAAILKPAGTLGLENISVPFIYNKAYSLRNGRAVTSATATANQIPANQLHITVEPGKETHPLFSGITVGDSIKMFKASASDDGSAGAKTINFASDLEMDDATTLLAKLKGATGNISVCFNDIPAGTALGTEDTLKARMIAISENYGAISMDKGRNLTDENITIWRNAVYMLAGLEVPTTMIEAPSRIEIGYFNNDDRTMATTAAPFDADPIIEMLKGDDNFSVDVKIVAVDSVVDLSPYDLVIVQEGFTSGAAILKPGGTLGLENITVPFIYNKAYSLRNGRAVTSATATANQIPANQLHIVVEPGKETHPLFSGITMADSIKMFKASASDDGSAGAKTMNYASDLEMTDTTTLLAKLKDAEGKISVCFNDIPAGTVLGTEDTLKARMIAIGENYGAISMDLGRNLTDENITIWRNAVYLLAGLEVPTTLVEAPSRIEIGYFNNNDRTMAATAAPYEEDPVIMMLKEDLNFNVHVNIVAVDSVVDLSLFDIVVVQEGFNSGAAILKPGGSLALENITVPFIYNKAYSLRNGRAVTSAAAAAGQTPGKQLHIVIEEGKATHKLFSGITMTSDSIKMFKTPASDDGSDGEKTTNFAYDLEMSDTTTLLAKLKGAAGDISIAFNDIPAGTVLGTEDTLKARMIAISENYGAIARDMGANLTDENLTIWRNAFYLLAGLDVPATPLVAAKSANAYLSGISLSSGTLVPAFNKDSVNYEVELSAGTTSVDVTATAAHPLAGVTGDGTIDVSLGSGTATIIVTAENGSTAMTYTVEFTVLPEGIEEASVSTIRVYPTVSDRWFNIEAEEAGMIKIYDVSGRMISSQKMNGNIVRVEISEAGIYILDIETDTQRKIVRVVKTQ